MVSVKELDANERRHFKKMRELVIRDCDPEKGELYKPSRRFRHRHPKQNKGPLYPHRKQACMHKDRQIQISIYLPGDNSSVDMFDDHYVRCWFVYFYKSVLPHIFNNLLYERFDWMYQRVVESIFYVSGARISGRHYESEMLFESPKDFTRRASIISAVIKDWAPMDLRQFILSKIPKIDKKFNKNKNKFDFGLTLAMFEFMIASYTKALWQPVEREIAHRILDYLYQGKDYIDVALDQVLQPFYGVVEVSKIAAEQTLRRLLSGEGDMDRNQKLILFCFNESKFSYELFSNILVRALKPDVALADGKSRKEAKRAMQLAYRILRYNSEVEVCPLRQDLFILPGKYLLVLAQDKVLQAEAEKLSNLIAKTYPSIVFKIKDSEHVNIPLSYNYDW